MAELRIDEDGDLVIKQDYDIMYLSPGYFAELRDLLDKALAPAAPVAEVAAPPRWHMKGTALHFGDLSIFYHSSGTSETTDMSDYAEPRTFGDMADWLVEHQPAATLEQVQAWGRLDYAAPHVHAFIQQQIAQPSQPAEVVPARYQWSRDMDGDLCCRDLASSAGGCVMVCSLTHDPRNARLLTNWIVDAQPQALPLPLGELRGLDSWHVYDLLKPLMDAAQPPAEVADADSIRPRWFMNTSGQLDYAPSLGDDYVMALGLADVPLNEAQELSEWFISHQPPITNVDRAMLTGVGPEGKDSAVSYRRLYSIKANYEAKHAAEPLPFTPDRAEVSDDPRFWQDVADHSEAPAMVAFEGLDHMINDGTVRSRMLRVSFTFDPADILAARLVYAALEQLPYEIGKAVEIS